MLHHPIFECITGTSRVRCFGDKARRQTERVWIFRGGTVDILHVEVGCARQVKRRPKILMDVMKEDVKLAGVRMQRMRVKWRQIIGCSHV